MDQEKELEDLKNKCRDHLIRLNRNEDFLFFKETVVEPTILQLEVELSSSVADEMKESILRGKLKHLNSLKFFFKDVFVQFKEE
jgi:hypothetical protein